MMTEELRRQESVTAYECVLREINHRLNLLDTSPTSRVEYMTGKRLALEELHTTVSSWVRKIEDKEPKRIMVELQFIPVTERLPAEGHVVFVVTSEGSKPQRAYWEKRITCGVATLAAEWWAYGDSVRIRINNVTHWAEIPKVRK